MTFLFGYNASKNVVDKIGHFVQDSIEQVIDELIRLQEGSLPLPSRLTAQMRQDISGKPNRHHSLLLHDDVIKWKHFPPYWPFVRWIHRSPVDSPRKAQWRGALMLSFICACTNSCANNRDADDLRRHRAHYGVNVMENGDNTMTKKNKS